MADVINEYVQELPKKVRAIQEILAQANLETLQSLVRTMKSEGSAYGFDIITETAAKIETALINGSTLDDLQADLKTLAKLCNEALAYLRGKTVGDLIDAESRATADMLERNGRPVRVFRLARLDERSLGALLMHFMLETIVAAGLLGVNPFDQPAVEEGKALARAYLAGEQTRSKATP